MVKICDWLILFFFLNFQFHYFSRIPVDLGRVRQHLTMVRAHAAYWINSEQGDGPIICIVI